MQFGPCGNVVLNPLNPLKERRFAIYFSKKRSVRRKIYIFANGEMAEWSNAAVLKTVVPLPEPGVRIPLSPPA
jgi:hypothetical protein